MNLLKLEVIGIIFFSVIFIIGGPIIAGHVSKESCKNNANTEEKAKKK